MMTTEIHLVDSSIYVLFYSKTITFKNSDILCDSK